MCGIVAYIGPKQATEVLLDGLKRLEYRGYDSAGIAVLNGPIGTQDSGRAGESVIARCQGKLDRLVRSVAEDPPRGHLGIGHTRWATHGRPSDENAHPHKFGRVAVVHNGIIENFVALRDRLSTVGHVFQSETDTEILAHLIDAELHAGADPFAAVRQALRHVEGVYALAVLIDGVHDRFFCARKDAPLVLGRGDGEQFAASDIPSVLPHTREVIFLEDGDVAEVRSDGCTITDLAGTMQRRAAKTITWSAAMAEKGGYKHFMLKEIFEQPSAVTDTLRGRVHPVSGKVTLDGIQISFADLQRIYLVACGTSYHAALVGKFLIEGLARITVEVDLASEFRYRNPLIGKGDLLVAISQSGETADTMAAVREAKGKGARVMAVTNVIDSSIARAADATFYTHAGPEIGVASTKAFTTQLTALLLLALAAGRETKALSAERAEGLLKELMTIPHQMKRIIDQVRTLQDLAHRYADASDWLYLGRGVNYPIALEGALKLKEISYIHAEGYPAGEMKHGPIALINEQMPVVILAPKGPGYEKVMSNLQEVRARAGKVIAIATEGDSVVADAADAVFFIPDVAPPFQPLLTVLPLQLLAYYVADAKGTDVDQPRNLAKSVTVE
ncbi:MAG: glutamine--fructose-6-phosphate transaminase (isomerizing) [Deltaproteobacteria bacterium]|nr:glutamine--fructose-6-phosphate transaminase (isomerizing) [Deltaproteobacteria bacterium]